jgi:YVTN family beta-propeller protein
MKSDSSIRRPSFLAWGYAALWAALMMQLGAIAAAAAPFAYVANSGSNIVSVIDTATNKVVATVPVGGCPHGGCPDAVAVTPDGTRVYVTSSGSVIVINATTNKVVATVPGREERGYGGPIAITPDGTKAYVGAGQQQIPFNFIAAIDTASNTLLDDIVWPSSGCCLAVTPNGKYLYTIGDYFGLTELSVIDTATNALVGGLGFGGGVPAGLAITPDGKAVYLSIDTNVSVIDTARRTVVATVPGVAGPVAITPDGKRAYVASSPVAVIDTASKKVMARVPVGSQPSWVAVTPDGKYAYVTNRGSNNVSVIDTASNTVRATVAVGNAPVRVGIIPPRRAFPSAPSTPSSRLTWTAPRKRITLNFSQASPWAAPATGFILSRSR